jgi:co-chaperonin GroES (HSP10)
MNNWVYIEVDKAPTTINGVFAGYRRDDMRAGQHVEEYDVKPIIMFTGTVLAVPNVLRFLGKEFREIVDIPYKNRSHDQSLRLSEINRTSTKYDVEIEIKAGDKVYFTRMATLQPEFKQGFIQYSELVARKRGDKIYPLNGCLLVEPVKKETLTASGLILGWKREEHLNLSQVKHVGSLVKGYKDKREFDTDEIQVGDLIWHDSATGVPIEDKNYRQLEENLHYIHRKDILYYGKERR